MTKGVLYGFVTVNLFLCLASSILGDERVSTNWPPLVAAHGTNVAVFKVGDVFVRYINGEQCRYEIVSVTSNTMVYRKLDAIAVTDKQDNIGQTTNNVNLRVLSGK